MSALRELLEIAARHRWYQAANGGNRLVDWPILTKPELNRRLAGVRRPIPGCGRLLTLA